MARKQQKITAISYVRVGGELVRTEDLDPERKKELANWLKVTYLNNLFRGKAVFRVAEEGEQNGTERELVQGSGAAQSAEGAAGKGPGHDSHLGQ